MAEFLVGQLQENFENAEKGMFIERGAWTVGAFTSCTVNCGTIVLKDGRECQVQITVQADKDEWIGE